ncbi:MAG: hypothetical protein L0Y76_05725 [Ignavibacteria bacterium]|nr:hypothetical protein [Ignavibacteria bacterium]
MTLLPELRVFKKIGKELAAFEQAGLHPGKHHFEFVTEGLTSGVYFARLTANCEILTVKMFLEK